MSSRFLQRNHLSQQPSDRKFCAWSSILWILLLVLFDSSVRSQTTSQVDEFYRLEKLNRESSDKAFQESVMYAMQALLDLSAAKIPSAFTNGFTAYGKYRTSEELELMALRSENSALKLESLELPVYGTTQQSHGSGYARGGSSITQDRKSNKGFLHEGKADAIAQEFEKRTGMKREKFYDYFYSASENKISTKDPQMTAKVMERFNGFVKGIPNQKFRTSLEKVLDKIPGKYRGDAIQRTVQARGQQPGKKLTVQGDAKVESQIASGLDPVLEKHEISAFDQLVEGSISDLSISKEEGPQAQVTPRKELGDEKKPSKSMLGVLGDEQASEKWLASMERQLDRPLERVPAAEQLVLTGLVNGGSEQTLFSRVKKRLREREWELAKPL